LNEVAFFITAGRIALMDFNEADGTLWAIARLGFVRA
jgi:hypothetical protein